MDIEGRDSGSQTDGEGGTVARAVAGTRVKILRLQSMHGDLEWNGAYEFA